MIGNKSQFDKYTGLPDNLLETLAENARKDAKEGWVIDLKVTTYVPLMKYAENRDLRREIYMAYSSRCMTGSEFDNRDHVREIVNTRLEIARLLGYKNYADYVLTRRMAGNTECPVSAISEGDIYVIDPETCTDCGTCAEVCPTEAISPA